MKHFSDLTLLSIVNRTKTIINLVIVVLSITEGIDQLKDSKVLHAFYLLRHVPGVICMKNDGDL